MEIGRLASVLERIRAEGFRLLDGPQGLPRARILSAGETFAAVVFNGQHRIAALAALGATAAPVWPLPDTVRREAVLTWPGVQAGLFTPGQALAVFDRILEGRQPDCLGSGYWWVEGPLSARRQGSSAH